MLTFMNRDGSPETMEQRLSAIENMMYESRYDTGRFVKSQTGKGFEPAPAPQIFYGCWQAYCVDTVDPHKINRVRFFMPMLHEDDVKVGQLPWARPISNLGGFDDCGLNWPPPAGSRLLIIFEHGDRRMPYYLGTSWTTNRGQFGSFIPGPKQEWEKLWSTDRAKGYLSGAVGGAQDFPPWNGESYNGFDFTSDKDFEKDIDAQQKVTYPNIYGMKTPGRHGLKMVDGNHNCNDRWKRVELFTSRSNILVMKDDHLHPAGQWAKNIGDDGTACCEGSGEDLSQCKDLTSLSFDSGSGLPGIGGGSQGQGPVIDLESFLNLPPLEQPTCGGNVFNSKCNNPYYKREEECRPYRGERIIELPQSGIQLQTAGGIQFVMDDSVDEPRGKPTWELDFDTGCNDQVRCKTFWKSWGGHIIVMNDDEEPARQRSDKNMVRIESGGGHSIELNDHSQGEDVCVAQPDCGITIMSRSRNSLRLMDEGNEQFCNRRGSSEPVSKAKDAFIELRTGYGLLLHMSDANSQEETQQQNIIIRAPQKDNVEMGAHELLFQESPSGPGLVMLTVGGYYYCVVKTDSFWQVGTEEAPGVREDVIFGDYLVDVEKGVYYNKNDLTLFLAKDYILLGAGEDCELPDTSNAAATGQQAVDNANANVANVESGGQPQRGPCFFPIIVASEPWACPYTGFIHFGVGWGTNSMSDRIIASSSSGKKA